MKRNHWFKPALVFIAVAMATCVVAQPVFLYRADLEKPQQAGFYKIVLDPAVVAKCRIDLSDLRIMDSNARQVPYILTADQPVFRESRFTELPILSVKKEKDKQTHLVIQNKPGKPVSELLLVIRNTAAYRTVTVSGSDDKNRWFVIQENIALDHFFNPDKDSFIQSLNFPTSSYKYFKIIINGEDLLPVNIVRAGIYEDQVHNAGFSALPAPVIAQKDSADGSSYISLVFNDSFQVDKLNLEFTGPKYFVRGLSIDGGNSGQESLSVRSDAPADYTVHAKTNRLTLRIRNGDNPVLRLSAVRAWQLNRWLLTYLEPANDYHLAFGNAEVPAPSYDLAAFKSSIGNTLLLKTGPVRKPEQARPGKAQLSAKWNTALLWIVIAAVLLLLLLLTFRMTRQVDRKENP